MRAKADTEEYSEAWYAYLETPGATLDMRPRGIDLFRWCGDNTIDPFQAMLRAKFEERDYTRLFQDCGRARTHLHSADGHLEIQEYSKCPSCGAMAREHDDSSLCWTECTYCHTKIETTIEDGIVRHILIEDDPQ